MDSLYTGPWRLAQEILDDAAAADIYRAAEPISLAMRAMLAGRQGDLETAERLAREVGSEWPPMVTAILAAFGGAHLGVIGARHGLEAAWTWYGRAREAYRIEGAAQEEVVGMGLEALLTLDAIQIPGRGQDAAVLAGVGIAQHDFLDITRGLQQGGIGGVR